MSFHALPKDMHVYQQQSIEQIKNLFLLVSLERFQVMEEQFLAEKSALDFPELKNSPIICQHVVLLNRLIVMLNLSS